jgi:hypothetical protein
MRAITATRRTRGFALVQTTVSNLPGEDDMNEEALNHSIRKFLKTVGVSSQRYI